MGSVKKKKTGLFNPDDAGSKPAGPTINRLVAKKCNHCGLALHLHRVGDNVTFSNCEPSLVDIKIEKTGLDEMTIIGRRSTKAVRCQGCKKRHMLSTFEDITDGNSLSEAGRVT